MLDEKEDYDAAWDSAIHEKGINPLPPLSPLECSSINTDSNEMSSEVRRILYLVIILGLIPMALHRFFLCCTLKSNRA